MIISVGEKNIFHMTIALMISSGKTTGKPMLVRTGMILLNYLIRINMICSRITF